MYSVENITDCVVPEWAWCWCLHAQAFMWRSILKMHFALQCDFISLSPQLSLSVSTAVTWTLTVSSLFLSSEETSSGYGLYRSTSRAPDWLDCLLQLYFSTSLTHLLFDIIWGACRANAAWKTKRSEYKWRGSFWVLREYVVHLLDLNLLCANLSAWCLHNFSDDLAHGLCCAADCPSHSLNLYYQRIPLGEMHLNERLCAVL